MPTSVQGSGWAGRQAGPNPKVPLQWNKEPQKGAKNRPQCFPTTYDMIQHGYEGGNPYFAQFWQYAHIQFFTPTSMVFDGSDGNGFSLSVQQMFPTLGLFCAKHKEGAMPHLKQLPFTSLAAGQSQSKKAVSWSDAPTNSLWPFGPAC